MSSFNKINKQQDNGWYIRNFSNVQLCQLGRKNSVRTGWCCRKEIKQAYCIENLEFCVSCMDYTTLKVSDTEESVKNFTADLLKKLKKFNLRDVAAVCVFSNYAGIVREGLKGTEIQTAVVAGNFPNSQTFTEIKLAECKMAIGAGAQEVMLSSRSGIFWKKIMKKYIAN